MFKKFVAILLVGFTSLYSQVTVDKNLKNYEVKSGITGNINSVGSDTLNNLMTLWVEGFNKKYPNTRIQVEGKVPLQLPRLLPQEDLNLVL